MPSATLATTLDGAKVRLLIDGGWSLAAEQAIRQGGFDRIELQRGEYENLECLLPFEERIKDLWINSLCRSTAGIEGLKRLERIQLGYPASKGIDFQQLPALSEVVLEHWKPHYGDSLFGCNRLQSLSIDSFPDMDCKRIGKLSELRSVALFRGAMTTLEGLRSCEGLDRFVASNMKHLKDIHELGFMSSLHVVELREKMSALHDLRPLYGLVGLRHLDAKGCDAKVDSVDWLARCQDMETLLLPCVMNPDWTLLLSSKKLRLLLVGMADERAAAIELSRAKSVKGRQPTESKILGKGRNVALLFRF